MGEGVNICKDCDLPFKDNETGINCAFCDCKVHLQCVGITTTTYNYFKKIDRALWRCKNCDIPEQLELIKALSDRLSKMEGIINQHSILLKDHSKNLKDSMKITVPYKSSAQQKSSSFASSALSPSFGSPLAAVMHNNKRTYASLIENNSNSAGANKKLRVMNEAAVDKPRVSAKPRDKSVLFVKPKALSEKTKDEMKNSIKSVLDHKTDPIIGLKTTNSGHVIVQCKDVDSVDQICKKLAGLENEYEIRKVEKRWPKLLITGIDKEDCEHEADFIALLKEKNSVFDHDSDLKVVKFFGAGSSRKAQIECDIKTYERVIDLKKLVVGWNICPIFESIEVLRCFNCQSFGHMANDCPNEKVCSICTGPHQSSTCKEKNFKCINCINFNREINENDGKLNVFHPCFTVKCPLFKHKLEKKRRKVQYYD